MTLSYSSWSFLLLETPYMHYNRGQCSKYELCRLLSMRRQNKSRVSPATTGTLLAKLLTSRKYVKTAKRHRQQQSDAKVKHDNHSLPQVPDCGSITWNKDTLKVRIWRAEKKKPDTFHSSL